MKSLRRIVVKFGTAVLTLDNGRLNEPLIRRWVDLLADLRDEGREILIVTSGAIGAGLGEMNLEKRPDNLPDKQALAAIGQSLLMSVYSQAFRRRGYHVAQILLTRGDLDDRRRHLNVRNCLHRLLKMGVIPIINENDTVSVDELCFSDNDILSAIMASKCDADLLVIFSDVDGLYERDPRKHPDSKVVPVVRQIASAVEDMAGDTRSALGVGGMQAKIVAAKAATRAGIPVIIARGLDPSNLRRILAGESVGTRFEAASGARLSSRDRWIALGARSSNRRIVVDAGARRALVVRKTSLLPVGVAEVQGEFQKGDVVEICDKDGQCFAKGLTNYSSEEIARIRGRKSSDIGKVLGEKRYDEVVHRDNLVVLDV
ncbi:MAG: glutamate 5-kinase [Candidatus Sumerlaeota bacterium]|nr:glutamate 5-kinase [Candidatus Sumerlaeota bacterium]